MKRNPSEPGWLDMAYDLFRSYEAGEIRSEIVPTEDACLRVVAEDVSAPEPIPRVPYAVRSGHAVRAAETSGATFAKPIDLTKKSGFAAFPKHEGDPALRALAAGESESMPAGMPLPEHADAVLPSDNEKTDHVSLDYPEGLRLTAPLRVGANVRLCGEDYARGATLVTRGTRLTAQLQAVLIAAGVLTIPVYKRPRIGVVLSSYDTVPAHEVIYPWQRRDASGNYARSILARWGHAVPPVEQIPPISATDSIRVRIDENEAYRKRLRELMSRYDLLIGVGMPADSALQGCGLGGPLAFPMGRCRIKFDGDEGREFSVALGDDRSPRVLGKRMIYRPGSTTDVVGCEGFAYYDRAIVLTLPGYTPDIAAIMHVAVRMILDLMEGVGAPGPFWRRGALANPITRRKETHRFLWGTARIDEGRRVAIEVNDDQNGLDLRTFSTANVLVAIQSGTGRIESGELVDYVATD